MGRGSDEIVLAWAAWKDTELSSDETNRKTTTHLLINKMPMKDTVAWISIHQQISSRKAVFLIFNCKEFREICMNHRDMNLFQSKSSSAPI